ncbi:hypothetical protein TNCV_1568171 [Trichonephila clavipes]|nr:hypothetical protein TNCV_1568171 [Trichonephila clavipes]
MDVCKRVVPSRHGSTLNSRRATSLLVRLVEEEERLKWAGHLARMNEDRSYKKIFLAKPMGNRPRRRLPLRWIDCVEKDINILKVKNWKTVTKSRDAWRKLLEKARTHPGLRAIEEEECYS